jgi:hypothetical protein
MSLKIGGSKSNSSGSSNTQTNSTTTPIVPDWASTLTQNVAGRVGGLTQQDPQSFVAPANGLQTQAGTGAAGLSGSPWNYEGALDLTRGAANTSWLDGYMNSATPFASGGKASNYVASYLDPYLQNVVDSTSADLDAHDGQVRAQQALALAGSGVFGGSGAALTQSMTEGELARARASSLGGLRSQAYGAALGAAAGDADRATQARIANAQTALQDRAQKVGFGLQGQQQQLAAGSQLAGLSSAYDANQRANIQAQAGVGDDLRNIAQQQDQAPMTSTAQIVAMLNGLPINLFTGQTTQGSQSGTSTSKTNGSNWGLSFDPAAMAAQALSGGSASAIMGAAG